MKLTYIIFKDIINFLRRETRVFIIMSVTLVSAVYMVLFLYNMYLAIRTPWVEHYQNEKAKKYIVEFPKTDFRDNTLKIAEKKQEIVKKLADKKIMPDMTRLILETENNKMTVQGYYVNDDYLKGQTTEGRAFTQEEIAGSANVTITSSTLFSFIDKTSYVGESFTYQGHKYKIIGMTFAIPVFYIPYTTYLKHNYDITTLRIIYEKRLSSKQWNLFKNSIKNSFPDADITPPPAFDSISVKRFILYVSIIIILTGFALLNVVSLFKFWASKSAYRYSVYNLCGSKKSDQYFLITMEALIINLISFVAGVTLYYLSIPFLKQVRLYYHIGKLEVILILSIYLFFVFASINPVSKKIARITPINRDL